MSDKISVGAISGAYGVRGELRIKSYCAVPEDIESYSPLSSEDGTRSFNLALVRPVKNGFVARITDVTSKEEADALRGTGLYAPRDRLPTLPDDEFYHTDLIGLAAKRSDGELYGSVSAVHNFGAGDILEIERIAGVRVMLPFNRETVPEVDIDAGVLIVDPPPGLEGGVDDQP